MLAKMLGWGQSIVEYLDLEELAEALHQLGRSTYFLSIYSYVLCA